MLAALTSAQVPSLPPSRGASQEPQITPRWPGEPTRRTVIGVWRELLIGIIIGFAGGIIIGAKLGWRIGLLRLASFEIRQRRQRARW